MKHSEKMKHSNNVSKPNKNVLHKTINKKNGKKALNVQAIKNLKSENGAKKFLNQGKPKKPAPKNVEKKNDDRLKSADKNSLKQEVAKKSKSNQNASAKKEPAGKGKRKADTQEEIKNEESESDAEELGSDNDESEEDEVDDSGADLELDEDNSLLGDEAEESEEEEEEDEGEGEEEEDDDDEDEGEDAGESSDNEENVKSKKSKIAVVDAKKKSKVNANATGIPNISDKPVPEDYPEEQVIFLKNLPKNVKQIDLLEIFAKYGSIHTIYIKPYETSAIAFIAFETAKSATSALAAHNKAKLQEKLINVSMAKLKNKTTKLVQNKMTEEYAGRSVFIKNLRKGCKEAEVRKLLEGSGTIERIRLYVYATNTSAAVGFADAASVPKALTLHNSIVGGLVINVDTGDHVRAPERTITLKNVENLTTLEADRLQRIFSKCGEIENIDVLCKMKVLAFITFKNEKSIEKALKLNGETIDSIKLDIVEYLPNNVIEKRKVVLINIAPGTTEEEITTFFESSGPIHSIDIRQRVAIVTFADSDGYCKSFLRNCEKLKGNVIFLEPFSFGKDKLRKRPNSNFSPKSKGAKRPKFNKK